MSQYELNNDLRKYMGLDEPNEQPVARLERATGGSVHHKKRNVGRDVIAPIGAALGTALTGATVANYMSNRSQPEQAQPTGRQTYTRETMHMMPKPYKKGGKTNIGKIVGGTLGGLGALGAAGAAANKLSSRQDPQWTTRESSMRTRLPADDHHKNLLNQYRDSDNSNKTFSIETPAEAKNRMMLARSNQQ